MSIEIVKTANPAQGYAWYGRWDEADNTFKLSFTARTMSTDGVKYQDSTEYSSDGSDVADLTDTVRFALNTALQAAGYTIVGTTV